MNNYYSTGSYKHDPTTFGGYIYNYDYNEYVSMSDIAGRILADMKFDKKCKELATKKARKDMNKTNKGEE